MQKHVNAKTSTMGSVKVSMGKNFGFARVAKAAQLA